jgi:hypothetical protein
MFATLADFLLGAALSRRSATPSAPTRSPSRLQGRMARNAELGWMARVGTW